MIVFTSTRRARAPRAPPAGWPARRWFSSGPAKRLRVIGLGSVELPPRELSPLALAEAAAGRLHPTIGQTFPLEDAAAAHAAIERRATVGKTLLIPGHPR